MKGTYKGVSGLVVKPISGALDFFSKTSEGIKNTTKTVDKEVEKVRALRPFYGKKQQIKNYDKIHALIIQHMLKIGRGVYARDHFIDAIDYATPKLNTTIVLTQEHIFMVDNIRLEVLKSFESKELLSITKEENKYVDIYIAKKKDGDKKEG